MIHMSINSNRRREQREQSALMAFLTHMEGRLMAAIHNQAALQEKDNLSFRTSIEALSASNERLDEKVDGLSKRIEEVANDVKGQAKTESEIRTRRREFVGLCVAMTTLIGFAFILVDRGVI